MIELKAILSTLSIFLIQVAKANVGYCGNHTFDTSKNAKDLLFSKENSDEEFGIYEKLKCLHCCCTGYRSIEWFKDGLSYPWPTNVSTLIIDPESNNQTIYSQQLTFGDAGKYWCVVRNNTHSLQHHVLLTVSGPSISLGWPKTTYKPRDQMAAKGEFVRFYCEAFVGTIDLPDFQSEISWERFDFNQSFINKQRIFQEIIFREEKRVLGSYLIFNSVEHEDYGKYTCKVRNFGDQVVQLEAWLKFKDLKDEEIFIYQPREKRLKTEIFFVILLVLIALVLIMTFAHFKTNFRLPRRIIFRNSLPRGKIRRNFLIIYHKNDSEVLSKIVPILNRSHYGCTLHCLHCKTQLGEEELNAKADSYQGLIVLMTSVFLGGVWSAKSIKSTIESLLKIHFTVICIFFQELPILNEDDKECQLLRDSLKKIQFAQLNLQGKTIKWNCSVRGTFPSEKEVPPPWEICQKLI